MIESRLDPLTDGSAGDYGGYPALTVAETARRFRLLAADHRPSSVSSILRIAQEQSKGRQSLTGLVPGSAFFSIFYLLLVFIMAYSPEPQARRSAGECAFFGMLLFVGPIVIGTLCNRERILRSHAQLRELRRLALEALDAVVASPWFVPNLLDREERKTLRALRGVDPDAWGRVAWILTEAAD